MAVSGGIVEAYRDGGIILTCKVAAAIEAGQLVVLTANSFEVNVAGANEVKKCGVALRKATAVGDKIPVAFPGAQVYKLKAAGAIDCGSYVKTGAAGTVVAIAADGDPRLIVGFVLEDIADTALGKVALL
jgi:Uncharacterized conserved protein (DUF2190)